MAWEALNNIAEGDDRRLVIVVNDNGRSYTPTVGGLANHLTTLRTSPRYEQILDLVKRRLNGVRGVGPAVYDALHAMKKGMKDALAPQGLFEDLGLKYVGPIDGHDRAAVEQALAPGQAVRRPGDRARASPARASATTRRSATRPTSSTRSAPSTSRPVSRIAQGPASGPTSSPRRWSRSAPSARTSSAITAAMLYPVGLDRFAAAYPDRTFDVGIAEQHAATSAPPAWRWAACTRWSRSTRPSSTAPSTRC